MHIRLKKIQCKKDLDLNLLLNSQGKKKAKLSHLAAKPNELTRLQN